MSGRDVEGATLAEYAAAFAHEVLALSAVILFVAAFCAFAMGAV